MSRFFRSVLCAIICACLLTGAAFAQGADLSHYSDNQLIELLYQVQQEIADRRIEAQASLPGGEYIAGKDIPAGKYIFKCVYKGTMWANLSVYGDRGKGKQKLWKLIVEEDGPFETMLTLEEGDQLKCDEPFTLTIHAGVMFR